MEIWLFLFINSSDVKWIKYRPKVMTSTFQISFIGIISNELIVYASCWESQQWEFSWTNRRLNNINVVFRSYAHSGAATEQRDFPFLNVRSC